ncbi:MAG: DUF4359 domain-containing protein [Synechococcales bacterium]|nr:DUF4359 domain-containing protein [Synechococcales bacterium]
MVKPWQWTAGAIGLSSVGIGGVMWITNPTQEAFENYAIAQLKTELCPQIPLGFAKQCPKAVDDNQDYLKNLIRKNTTRQDYVLFSHYYTHLSVRSLVPETVWSALAFLPIPTTYRLEAVGMFGQFFIYQAKSQSGI